MNHDSPNPAQTCLIVLGMHRSGTSAMTGALNLLGIHLGSKLLPPNEFNPKGYFEHQELVQLNDEILAVFDGSWDSIFPLPTGWERDPKVDPIKKKVKDFLLGEFSNDALFALKDPRLSITLPLWQSVLEELQFQQKYIVVLRHPEEISLSLQKREQFSPEKSYLLWTAALLGIEYHTRHQLRTFIQFEEDLIASPGETFKKVIRDLNLDLKIDDQITQVRSFLEPQLKHHFSPPDEKATQYPGFVEDLRNSLALLSKEGHSKKDILKQVNQIRKVFFQHVAFFYNQEIVSLKSTNETLQTSLKQKEELIHQLTQDSRGQVEELRATKQELASQAYKLKLKELLLKSKNEQLKINNDQLANKDQQIKTQDQELHIRQLKEKELADYAREIGALRSSITFKAGRIVTAPFRWIYDGWKSISGRNSNLETWSALLNTAIKNPITLLKVFNFKHLRTLRKAVGNESPQFILQNFRRLLGKTEPGPGVQAKTPTESPLKSPLLEKEVFTRKKRQEFLKFLRSGKELVFPVFEQPVVSILLLFYNRAELSFDCLSSILEGVSLPFEVIIVDNASTDETTQLLHQIKGAVIAKNKENTGFVKGSNQASRLAKGDYLLFLNNDTMLEEGSLESAFKTLKSSREYGAVGGRIIMLNGKLQEAGSIIWKDGSCLGYGRNEDPERPEFMFSREVDFCSGVFLLTPAKLFRETGGFDERFSPAYYEEVDYCMKLREKGYKIIYDPGAVVRHFEFASSRSQESAIALQTKNRRIFYQTHKAQLSFHFEPDLKHLFRARFSARPTPRKKILVLDDKVPHVDTGSGFPRANLILNLMLKLGYQPTMVPLNFLNKENWEEIYRDIDPDIEIIPNVLRDGFGDFIRERAGLYDIIWVSRPHNMEFFNQHIELIGKYCPTSKIIYDAEAIFAKRDLAYARIKEDPQLIQAFNEKLEGEVNLAETADLVITVTLPEKNSFLIFGHQKVEILNVVFDINPTPNDFQDREGLLFVGNLDNDDSPNVDSLVWFMEKVYPLVEEKTGPIPIHIVGSNNSALLTDLARKNKNMILHGRVSQLNGYFNKARLFIAPTRYSAGSPAKALQAAAFGLPIIATTLIIGQLAWKKGSEIDGAAWLNPQKFANVMIQQYSNEEIWKSFRGNLIQRVQKELSLEAYEAKLASILEMAVQANSSPGNRIQKRKLTAPSMGSSENTEKYFYIHIPKTAGSSFINTLSQKFRWDLVFANNQYLQLNNGSYPNYWTYLSLSHAELNQVNLLVGHIPFTTGGIFPRAPKYLVMLRHPVERAVSQIFYLREHRKEYNDLSPEEVYKKIKNQMFNLQVRFFADLDLNNPHYFFGGKPIDKMALRTAKENLRKCAFIGIKEEFDNSITLLNQIFGWNLKKGARVNVTENKFQVNLPEWIIDELSQGNEEDLAFYDYGKSLFESLKIKHKIMNI